MKPRTAALLLGLAACSWSRLAAQALTQAAADSAALQGSWSMISGAADGYPLPPDYVRSMRRVFAGREVTVMMGQQLFLRATVVLGGSGPVRAIDYHMTGGQTAGAVQLGIFAIAGDTVRFCFGAPSAPRPTDFTSTQGDRRTLSTWVRTGP
jgi:uncharacterized protein (TIGR03067 family)